jgi:SPW repeat
MANLEQKFRTAWQDVINLGLGAWLVLSPMILNYANETAPATNSYIIGLAIIVMAAAAIWSFQTWEEWINAVLGVWLIISPWALGYSGLLTPMWNHIIVGVLVGGLALWAAVSEPRDQSVTVK